MAPRDERMGRTVARLVTRVDNLRQFINAQAGIDNATKTEINRQLGLIGLPGVDAFDPNLNPILNAAVVATVGGEIRDIRNELLNPGQ
jgi:hypothetical protein